MVKTNTSPDILENELRVVVRSPEARLKFARSLWKPLYRESLMTENFQPPNFEDYFGFYQDQCITWLCDKFAQDSKTHKGLVEKARHIASLDAQQLQSLLQSQDDAEKSWMFLAVRVLTMIDVGGLRNGIKLGQVSRNWTSGSLRDFIKSTFPCTYELSDHVKLERLFTARNLERVADIQVIWTSNIADHLQLEDDDTKVRLFSHASFLELHRQCDLFPAGFVDETFQTLSLLLPSNDKKTVAWYRREQRRNLNDEFIDGKAITGRPLSMKERQIDNFEFWHDRLVMLKQASDEADPKTVRQWWSDRRKPVQWFNFWFAIALVVGLTFFFGLVQSIEGGIQVYKAYYPS